MTTMTTMKSTKVLLERYPYRFCESGILPNGKPDCRLQKYDLTTKRYREIYLFDNEMQMLTAMSDINYARWLDPDGVPCYNKASGVVSNPYPKS